MVAIVYKNVSWPVYSEESLILLKKSSCSSSEPMWKEAGTGFPVLMEFPPPAWGQAEVAWWGRGPQSESNWDLNKWLSNGIGWNARKEGASQGQFLRLVTCKPSVPCAASCSGLDVVCTYSPLCHHPCGLSSHFPTSVRAACWDPGRGQVHACRPWPLYSLVPADLPGTDDSEGNEWSADLLQHSPGCLGGWPPADWVLVWVQAEGQPSAISRLPHRGLQASVSRPTLR